MNIINNLLKIEKISDFGLLFLTWLNLEEGSTSLSTDELSQLFNKHPVNLNKQIKRLAEQNLLTIYKEGAKKNLKLSDFVKNSLYNYNINYSITTSNKNNNNINNFITDQKIQVVSELAVRQFLMYNPNQIKDVFNAISLQKWNEMILKSNFGKAVLSTIKNAVESKIVQVDIEPDYDEFLYQVKSTLKFIFQNKPFPPRDFGGPTKQELAEQERQKKFEEREERRYANQFLCLNEWPDRFQSSKAVNTLAKIQARLNWVREAGKLPMGNLHMELLDGTEVNATITNEVYKHIKDELDSFKGKDVIVRGKIVYNEFYKRNILKNCLSDRDAVRLVFPLRKIDLSLVSNNENQNNRNVFDDHASNNFDDESPF